MDKLPSAATFQNASKIAIQEDRPILLDYWKGSLEKSVLIGVRESNEKMLVKNPEEYTSPISKIYKIGDEYIISTENSLYIVAACIPTKRIN